MPRITAPTIAEHRDRRRAALLDAARTLVLADGGRAVTMAAVAEGAGLSRTAVYEYFSSSADLLATLVVDEMAAWKRAIADQLGRLDDPHARIEAYARTTIELGTRGLHRMTIALGDVPAPAECRDAVERMRLDARAPLVDALREAGTHEPLAAAALIAAAVDAASARIDAGADADREADTAARFAVAGAVALEAAAAHKPRSP